VKLFAVIKAGWLRFAHVLGRFNTRLLLTIVFGTIFLVINTVMRLTRRDPLRMNERDATTLWLPVEEETSTDPLVAHRRQF